MSLNFSDTELKVVSLSVVNAPDEIAALQAQRNDVVAAKGTSLLVDDSNKLFYNNEKNIIACYHKELEYLSGTIKTNYSDTDLDNAAQLKEGNIHFPSSPIWTSMIPKLHASNNGNPTTSATFTEVTQMAEVTSELNFIKTGYSDGSTSTTTGAVYTGGATLVSTVNFAAGNRLLVDGGGNYAFLKVISSVAAAPNYQLTCSVIVATTGTIPSGSSIKNYYSGWTDAQRKETSTPPYANILHYYESQLDSKISLWETTLNGETTQLSANSSPGSEAANNLLAKNSVQNAISAISSWKALPSTGVSGRYGDSNLSTISTQVSARNSKIPSRITEIITALGSVSQNADGSFSGTGHYFSFFKWVDIRDNKAYGTLRAYYNFDLILLFMDQKIAGAVSKKAEYEVYMIAKKLTADSNGSPILLVTDLDNLSNGDTIKIMDNSGLSIEVRTIVGLAGTSITVNSPVSGFTKSQIARIVKLL